MELFFLKTDAGRLNRAASRPGSTSRFLEKEHASGRRPDIW